MGPAVGVGVGAGSSFFLILMGFAAFILVSGFLSDRSEGSVLAAAQKTSVLKLQVRLPFITSISSSSLGLLLLFLWAQNGIRLKSIELQSNWEGNDRFGT